MIGCQCCGIEDVFDEKSAAMDLKRYIRDGPKGTTRNLLDALRAEGVEEATLLDIGGGIGAIQFELLRAGLDEAIGVEASGANVRVARAEAQRRGVAERVKHHHADFVEIHDQLPEVDIVTLDRVICCYRNMPALICRSAGHARSLFGIIYPRDTWLNKLVVNLINLFQILRRSPFRVFIHATAGVDRRLREEGLQMNYLRRTPIWQVMVYRRQM